MWEYSYLYIVIWHLFWMEAKNLPYVSVMYVGGRDSSYQLGIKYDKTRDDYGFVSSLTENPDINVNDVRCISAGFPHTVVVMNDGKVFAAGRKRSFLGACNDHYSENAAFSEIHVGDEEIAWAAAGYFFTIYLTKSGKAIVCHRDYRGEIEIMLQKTALTAFKGGNYGGVIDEDGCVYFIDDWYPRRVPKRFKFEYPAVEVVCCKDFQVVLLSDFRVYGNLRLNNGKEEFKLFDSLADLKIIKIRGTYYSCLALSEEGDVFSYGDNSFGQLGDGTKIDNYEGFKQIKIPGGAKIKDISMDMHSL